MKSQQGKVVRLPGALYGCLASLLFFTIAAPGKFLTTDNLFLILRHTCSLLVASTGMTLVALVSQVDLSIGSVMSLSGVVLGVCLGQGVSLPAALILCLLVGVIFGLANGYMVTVVRFDYWITTFATMSIGAGLALVLSDGVSIPVDSAMLRWVGNSRLGPIYMIILLTALLVGIIYVLLKKTKLGYDFYSIGGSEQVAVTCGIDTVKRRITAYVLSGLLASCAGVMILCMNGTASPIIGTEYSFNALAAVIIGGTPLDGGKGGILYTLLGTLLLRILSSGLNLVGINTTWQKAITGAVIVMIISGDMLIARKKKRKGQMRVYVR